MKRVILFFWVLMFWFSCAPKIVLIGPEYDYSNMDKRTIKMHKKIEVFVYHAVTEGTPLQLNLRTRIDTLIIDDRNLNILVDFNKYFSFTPLREDNVDLVYKTMREKIGKKYQRYQLQIRSMEYPIEDLIPNYFRSRKEDHDTSRKPLPDDQRPLPLVRPLRTWSAPAGLEGKNIVVAHSHGWYYDNVEKRWEWMRPRMFQTVEDLLPMSFCIQYLIPMLENAGAYVFVPRERDIQVNEMIVDNDSLSSKTSEYLEWQSKPEFTWQTGPDSGFALSAVPYLYGVNPFRQGTYRFTSSDTLSSAGINWVPDIPGEGRYAVYISFRSGAENVDDARYTVQHLGGQSTFLINQQIGGGTWVYLGTFSFSKGVNPDSGSVRLSNISKSKGRLISADAVRFGGGMGNVSRGGSVSGRARFMEGARYYLQYAGMPDSLVYSHTKNQDDYTDDRYSRPEYANFLKGAPYGPNKNRQVKGLGIPIDLSLAFHTDAGISQNDTTIGTLMIYSNMGTDTLNVFPDSVSRLANRDYADILQTEIFKDIRGSFDPAWNRRDLMNSNYTEAYRQNMPSALLELLSHQNFGDMKFGMDPRFRFIAARAIYKGMLKFLATSYDYEYAVQPLPVTHFSATFDSTGNLILQWRPQEDPLEQSAIPSKYIIYVRSGNSDFSFARIVSQPRAVFPDLTPGIIYSFKVAALNDGGESFPSEILSVCNMPNAPKPVLIINGFDRISPPAVISGGDFSGFWNGEDQGVPDRLDIGFTGAQFDFTNNSIFRINDAPGHGNSLAEFETKIIPGNSFDFPSIHGESIKNAGYSFVSCSDEAVTDGLVDLRDFELVDLILGEEKETHWQKAMMDSLSGIRFKTFPQSMQDKIRQFTENGGNIFVSGAYPGKDMFAGKDTLNPDVKFAEEVLHYSWAIDHASSSGNVFFNSDSLFSSDSLLQFNQDYHPQVYTVEAPDALNPVENSHTILRYKDNNFSAAVAHKGEYKTVIMGFPFESIIEKKQRDYLMKKILEFLK
jgi:hypothetical protein